MIKLLQKSGLIIALSLPFMAYANPFMAYANSAASPTAHEAAAVDFCSFATEGVMRIAAARQVGIDQAKLVGELNQSMGAMRSQMAAATADTLDQYWKDATERLYQEPIYDSEPDKQAFVMAVGESSFNHCLEQTLATPKA